MSHHQSPLLRIINYIFFSSVFSFIFLFSSLFFPEQSYALDSCVTKPGFENFSGISTRVPAWQVGLTHTVSFRMDIVNQKYELFGRASSQSILPAGKSPVFNPSTVGISSNSDGQLQVRHEGGKAIITWTISAPLLLNKNLIANASNDITIRLVPEKGWFDSPFCEIGRYTVTPFDDGDDPADGPLLGGNCQLTAWQNRDGHDQCYTDGTKANCAEHGTPINFIITGLEVDGTLYSGPTHLIWQHAVSGWRASPDATGGKIEFTFTPRISGEMDTYRLLIYYGRQNLILGEQEKNKFPCQLGNFKVYKKSDCTSADCTTETIEIDIDRSTPLTPFFICDQIKQGTPEYTYCQSCNNSDGVWTALGCIKVDENGRNIITTLIRVGLTMAGGFGLISILIAAFMYSTSQGEVKRANDARDMMTAAVIGLLFIIFSVAILEFIGLTVLRIPGFGV